MCIQNAPTGTGASLRRSSWSGVIVFASRNCFSRVAARASLRFCDLVVFVLGASALVLGFPLFF